MEDSSQSVEKPVKQKLRWYQFSLRSLLIFVTLFAIPCSWLAVKIRQARNQRKAVDAIIKDGGSVHYDYEYENAIRGVRPQGLLQTVLGEDLFSNVVWANVKTDVGLEHLKELPKLQVLSLNGSRVTDGGLEHLEDMTQLKLLDLEATTITGTGLKHLKGLSQLEWLNISNTLVTDSNLAYLKKMVRLRTLALANTQISDTGIESLKGLKNLQVLYIRETKISESGFEKLQKALPNLKIKRK
jgi:hypothetical protein